MTHEHGVPCPPFESLDELLRSRPSLILHNARRSAAVADDIAQRFLIGTNRLFWWEALKVPFISSSLASFAELLERLRLLFPDPREILLLFPTDEQAPPWLLFEGTREDIAFAMSESSSSEFLIANRRRDVIAFETHHDVMIVAGADARAAARLGPAFSSRNPAAMPGASTLTDELDRDRQTARRNFRASLMSNTKWHILLQAVRGAGLDVRQVVVKFIDVADEKRMRLPAPRTPACVDSIEFGPFPLVGIEWLEFPQVALLEVARENVPAQPYRQDIAAIRAVIEATGKRFPLEDMPGGLRVVGHVR